MEIDRLPKLNKWGFRMFEGTPLKYACLKCDFEYIPAGTNKKSSYPIPPYLLQK